ncbi:hypothetical protein L1987_48541 [Smallanthus sonchifolius]|uniref:Uncharacterized protein n=1 Tax=Smallanthus sonchifolius TaxID=185202 RepID=A0ACB9FRX3_9ASTR|nr:hypothetical protein L1987_48541 [Smallanthus sonchifolius]
MHYIGLKIRILKIRNVTTLKNDKVKFEKVNYVEQLEHNLLSISQVCDKKFSFHFNDHECYILKPGFVIPDEWILMKAPRRNDTYVLDMSVATTTDSIPTCLLSKASESDSILWHRKLAHINYRKMNYIVRNDLVLGIPKMKFSVPNDCIPCKKGKQRKKSHKSKSTNSIVTPLELLHMDLFGPISIRSIGGKSYFLVVTDDYSRFSWVKFLSSKAETTELVQYLILSLENLFNLKVRRIRSDNGSEFKNSKMGLFCLQKGIHHEFSAPYVPQQNGVVERKNRTLVETARTMLADSKLPVTFWAEAVNTACHVLNRVLTVKRHNKTCYELLNNRKPNLEYLLPFGNPCTLLKVRDVPTKFSAKAIEGIFLGYVANSTTKRVYNKETRQVEEWFHIDCSNRSLPQMAIGPDWAFDYENLFKSFHLPSDISYEDAAVLYDSCQDAQHNGFLPNAVPNSSIPSTSASDPNVASCSGPQDSESEEDNVIFQDSSADPLLGDDSLPLTQDLGEIPSNLDSEIPITQDYSYQSESTQVDVLPVPEVASIKEHKDHPVTNIIGNLQDGVKTRSLVDNTCLYTCIKDSGVLDDCSHSCFISQEELAQFDKLKVWNLVDLPTGAYPIGTKWVFKYKKDDRGVMVRKKARLVIQGFNQQEGIDYTEVYAPVARLEAIRLFLAFASFKGFKVFQLDVKSAFLYGMVKEEVYVCQPPGFEDPLNPNMVFKLDKALYGLHQAPRAWYETLSTHLLANDFVRGKIDSTLFIKKSGGDYLLVQIYVDDIIFGLTNEGLCKDFEGVMKSKFEMSAVTPRPMAESSGRDIYHTSINMAPFEALYGRKCRSPICWNEIGEAQITGPELIQETSDKVSLIRDHIRVARSRQKSYADRRRKPLEFQIGDMVLLKVSPWKGVVRFGKKGKLAPRYVGPFKILERVGKVAYKLDLPSELSNIHPTFHVSNLKKCLADENLHIPLDEVRIDKNMHFVEKPMEIVDREVKKLKRSGIPIVKIRWESKHGPEFTWEREDQMKTKYPHLFS